MLRLILTLPFLILLVVFVLFNQTPGAMELPYLSWQSSVGVIATDFRTSGSANAGAENATSAVVASRNSFIVSPFLECSQ